MRNILLISDYAASYRGNFISSIEAIEKYLQEYGIGDEKARMVYLFPEPAKMQIWAKTFSQKHIVYFVSRSFYARRFTRADIATLRHIIHSEHIDLIHTHFIFYNYVLCIAHYTFARHIPIIGHCHNQFSIPNTRSAWLKCWVVEHTYTRIIGVSKSVAEGVKRNTHCTNVGYVTNAIAFERLNHYEQISLKDKPSQYVVLMAGWPALVKGVDIAVKAIKKLRIETDFDVKLCIMQSGDFAQTKRCVQEAIGEIPTWVQFLPPREDIATYYNAADVFLSASRTEAFSYCLVEAAYCYPMLVCSDIPGPNDLLIDGMKLFLSESVEAAAETIYQQFILSYSEKDTIRQQRKRFVQEYYSLDKWCQQIVEEYSNCIQ